MLVVQPRRVACRSLAAWLAEQRGEAVGERVGSWVRFERAVSEETRLVFATPGIALQLLRDDAAERYRAVMIDEFHERGWQTDLLAAVLARRSTPLVVTSATMDTQRVANALQAPFIEAEGRTFPLEITYADGPAQPSARDLVERVDDTLRRVRDATGDTLVFLPGKREIAAVAERLRAAGVDAIEVHGGVKPDVLARSFRAPSGGRVFVATNVAETSLTIPGVTTVVDSGLVRRMIHRAGRSVLALDVCSQAAMDQRAGRAGRVQAGRVIRLWSQRFRPAASLPPEVTRIPLDDVVLTAAALGESVAEADAIAWLDPPPAFAWAAARGRLRAAGALDTGDQVTPEGIAWASLPTGSDGARLLANAPLDLAGALADVVALTEQRRRLLLPVSELPELRAAEVSAARRTALGAVQDEVLASLIALRVTDARPLHLDTLAWRETRRAADQLRARIGVPWRAGETVPPRDALVRAIVARWPASAYAARPRALADRRKRGLSDREPWSNGEDELDVRRFVPDWLDPPPTPPVAGLVLEIAWLGTDGTRVRGVGSLVLPATYPELLSSGCGSAEVSEVAWASKRRQSLVATESVTLGGAVLGERSRRLTGAALRAALATLFCEDRWFRGGAAALEERLHLWRACADGARTALQLDEPPVTPVPEDAQAYVCETLAALGLETNEEIELVAIDDLLPKLDAVTGSPAWDLDRLVSEFPREWTYLGATYACRYQFRGGRVVLTPRTSKSAKAKPPAASVLPKFGGFRVFLEQASRRVQLR